MKIMDILVEELNKNLDGKVERLHSEPYQIVQTKRGLFKNPISKKVKKVKVEKKLLTYEAEFGDDEMEIILEYNDDEALREGWKLEKEHGTLFNLYLLDDDYNRVKTII